MIPPLINIALLQWYIRHSQRVKTSPDYFSLAEKLEGIIFSLCIVV